jgi:hypothetical protein
MLPHWRNLNIVDYKQRWAGQKPALFYRFFLDMAWRLTLMANRFSPAPNVQYLAITGVYVYDICYNSSISVHN